MQLSLLEIKTSKIFYLKMAGLQVSFKWANPGLVFVYFCIFQTNNTIFTTNQCENCHVHPVYGAGIQTHDLSNVSRLP